ncbi:hypothetical protein ACQPX6_22460 [Actinomycetospora sp. CA-101289]|uniref:hypothetical protein n=1 Tax=Actinomycetospora sp. CA-101289 TaxID=3239893 RepID=UPI003D95F0B5
MTLLDERHVPAPPTTRRHRVAGVLAVAVAVVLLTTALGLQLWLPEVTVAQHWSLAWSGLDIATAATALATAVLLHAADRRAALTASAGAALLLLDAWFDVCTAAGTAYTLAVTEALVLELPLAALAIGLALRLVDPRELRR